MTPTTEVDLLVGALMPALIALILQWHWSAKVKGLIALVVCAAVSAGVDELRGTLHWHDWRTTVIYVTGAAFALYHVWWKPSTIAPAIEQATTIATPPTAPPAAG